MRQVSSKTLFARKLRKKQIDVERLLWSNLRNRQLAGIKFERQQPIGQYIVDFESIEKKVIIELDGSQYGGVDNMNYDNKRTEFLQEKGLKY